MDTAHSAFATEFWPKEIKFTEKIISFKIRRGIISYLQINCASMYKTLERFNSG